LSGKKGIKVGISVYEIDGGGAKGECVLAKNLLFHVREIGLNAKYFSFNEIYIRSK